jgi:hypothetical protein
LAVEPAPSTSSASAPPEATPVLPEASAQRSRVAFSLATPSNASGGSETGAFNPQGTHPAGPQTAEEEEGEEGGEEEGGVVGQDPPCDVAGGPRVTARALSHSEIKVSWTIPPVPGCDDEVSVTVVGGNLNNFSTTDTSVTDTGLTPKKQYCYSVTVDDRGTGRACARTPEKQPPPPTGVSATAESSRAIVIKWNAAPRATGYDVEKASPTPEETDSTTGTSFSWSGLDSGTRYCFRVRSTNSGGQSDWTSPPTCATTPGPPSCDITGANMDSAVGSGTSAALARSYTDNRECTAVRYTVYRNDLAIRDLTGTDKTRATVPNLSPGTHAFKVKAHQGSEEATSASRTVTISCPKPGKPSGLGHRRSGSDVTVTWGAVSVSGCSISYKVWRDNSVVATVAGKSHTESRSAGTYRYQVSAVATSTDGTTSAESDRSDRESVTVPGCGRPDIPSGLTADRRGGTSTISVSWNRVSVPDNCSSVTYVLTRGGTEIRRTTGASYSDAGLDPGTYRYRVSAESNPEGEEEVEDGDGGRDREGRRRAGAGHPV